MLTDIDDGGDDVGAEPVEVGGQPGPGLVPPDTVHSGPNLVHYRT